MYDVVTTLEFTLLFDGGAAGGSGAAAGADTGAGGEASEQAKPADNGIAAPKSRRTGETQKVLYGKQPDDTAPAAAAQEETEQHQESDADRRKRYKDMIRGEFKEYYTQDTQRMIDERFKETKGLRDRVSAQEPIISLLQAKYGVNNAADLLKAIEGDAALWEAEADEKGYTTEQLMQIKQLERRNAQLEAEQKAREEEAFVKQQTQKWMADEAAVKQSYPEFDLQTEFQNPQFQKLLASGIPMQHAYEVMHMDMIKGNVAASTAAETEKKVTDNIRAKGARPAEAGANAATGVTVKNDVHKLSAMDRREIAKRVARGEKITF